LLIFINLFFLNSFAILYDCIAFLFILKNEKSFLKYYKNVLYVAI